MFFRRFDSRIGIFVERGASTFMGQALEYEIAAQTTEPISAAKKSAHSAEFFPQSYVLQDRSRLEAYDFLGCAEFQRLSALRYVNCQAADRSYTRTRC